MTNIKGRLNRLEAQRRQGFTDVISWIRAGRYYDELSDSEKDRYCLYRNSDRLGLEQLNCYFSSLHSPLEFNPAPPTSTEHAARVKELEQWFREAQEEFNSGLL